jgi:hypothetical protein
VFAPGPEEVSVNLKRFRVGDVEVPTPAGEGFPAGVGVVPDFLGAGPLRGEPVDREVDDGVVVEAGSNATRLWEPLWIHSLVSRLEHSSIQLDAGNRTVCIPFDFDRWVSIFSNDFSKVLWWRDVLLSWAETHSEDPPLSVSFLIPAQFATSVVEPRSVPSFLHVENVSWSVLDSVEVFL